MGLEARCHADVQPWGVAIVPKISDEPMETKQVTLFKADLDYLRGLYSSQLGVNRAIRTIVRIWITHSKAKANEMIDEEELSQ